MSHFPVFDPPTTCPTGITKGDCDEDTVYDAPSGGAPMFYTTWSFYMCFIAVGLLVLYLVMRGLGKLGTTPGHPKLQAFNSKVIENPTFQALMVALIAMPAINSVGVLGTSQLLIAKNFKLKDVQSGEVLGPEATKSKSLSTTFFKDVMGINLDVHILPGIVGIVILLCLALGRTRNVNYPGNTKNVGRTWMSNLGIVGLILALNLIVIGIWMAVPENDKRGIDKLNDVYADPPAYFFVIQLLLVVLLAFLVAFKIA